MRQLEQPRTTTDPPRPIQPLSNPRSSLDAHSTLCTLPTREYDARFRSPRHTREQTLNTGLRRPCCPGRGRRVLNQRYCVGVRQVAQSVEDGVLHAVVGRDTRDDEVGDSLREQLVVELGLQALGVVHEGAVRIHKHR